MPQFNVYFTTINQEKYFYLKCTFYSDASEWKNKKRFLRLKKQRKKIKHQLNIQTKGE